MSLESVALRVRDIEERIRSFSADAPAAPPAPASQTDAAGIGPADLPLVARTGAPPPQPFNVALARAQGIVSVRPSGGDALSAFEPIIARHSAEYGIDPALVRAVITAESSGDPRSVSSKGAMGLMQLMPDEVKGYGITDPFDPDQNIRGGVRQLAEKLRLFGGDVRLALAAYNAGSGAVRKYGGVPPYAETQRYVTRVLALRDQR